jgi:RNA polymerase sigma-70 factor, ECF subfamily
LETIAVERNDPEPDRDIVDAVRAVRTGNVQAYATIITRFQGPLMTLCTALLRNRRAAEELAQDTLVQAYERLDLFDLRQPMKPWLYKIAYRLAQQQWRAQSREAAHLKAAATLSTQNRDDSGPAERLLVDEQSEILWHAVSELPMAQRTAVVLYYREHLPVNDVAKTMGVTPGTVKTHLMRARSQIQINLRKSKFDGGDLS